MFLSSCVPCDFLTFSRFRYAVNRFLAFILIYFYAPCFHASS